MRWDGICDEKSTCDGLDEQVVWPSTRNCAGRHVRELGSCHPDDGFPRGVDLWRVPEHWVAQNHGVHRWSGMGERLSMFRFHDHLRPLADEVLDVHETVDFGRIETKRAPAPPALVAAKVRGCNRSLVCLVGAR